MTHDTGSDLANSSWAAIASDVLLRQILFNVLDNAFRRVARLGRHRHLRERRRPASFGSPVLSPKANDR
jgi:C4-dicarboxylate-specific signal transduction histidine kinase